ncbi:hypothetical protein CAPTEDRAFT_216759 [Capitella teleta]|uniref:Uncharacterized protein n=1 Tax=Capitella teleta TaxID=283909 RepID=R7V860_CAPTE|nr:hypothetical protein CAPTEDRAFT_216759 [Capitella teleta]|eukprot:ELU11955.1 hypothetical protein CAPTEDRAFT_216759 [Capitella teleta]
MASLARDEDSLLKLNLTKTASDDDVFIRYLQLALQSLPKKGYEGLSENGNIQEFFLLTLAYCSLIKGQNVFLKTSLRQRYFTQTLTQIHLKLLFSHLIGFCKDRIRRSEIVGSKKQLQKKCRNENYAYQERHPDPKRKTGSVDQQTKKDVIVKAREKVKQAEEKPPEVPKPTKEEVKAQKLQLQKEVTEILAKHKEQKRKEQEKEEKRRAKEEQKRREIEHQSLAAASLTTSSKTPKKKHKKTFKPLPSPLHVEPPKNWKKPNVAKTPLTQKSISQPQPAVQKKKQKGAAGAAVEQKAPAKLEDMNFNLFDEHGVVDDWGEEQILSRPGPEFSQVKGAPPKIAPYALPKKHDRDDEFIQVKGHNCKSHSNSVPKPPQTNVWEQRKLEQAYKFPKSAEEEDEMLAAVLEISKQETLQEQLRSPARPPGPDSFPAVRREDLFDDDLFGSPPSEGLEEFLPTNLLPNKSAGTLNALSQEWIAPLGASGDAPVDCEPAPQGGFLNALDQRLNPSTGARERLTMSSAASASPLHSTAYSSVTSDFSSEEEEKEEEVQQTRPSIDQLFGTMNVNTSIDDVDDDDDWALDDDIDDELDKAALNEQRSTYDPSQLPQVAPPQGHYDPLQSMPMGFNSNPTTMQEIQPSTFSAPRQPDAPQSQFQPLNGALASMGFDSNLNATSLRSSQPLMPQGVYAFPHDPRTVAQPPAMGTTFYASSYAPPAPKPGPSPQYDPTPAYDPFHFNNFPQNNASNSAHKPPGLQLLDEEVSATVRAIRGSGAKSTFQI